MFKLRLKTENDAVNVSSSGSGAYYEIARILRIVADKIEQEETEGNCRDINGNHIGT
jgi:hypothetical protein